MKMKQILSITLGLTLLFSNQAYASNIKPNHLTTNLVANNTNSTDKKDEFGMPYVVDNTKTTEKENAINIPCVEEGILLVEGAENKVKLGDKFVVQLEENASTGYSWSYTVDKNSFKLISDKYLEKENNKNKDDEPIVGAPSTRKWVFKANKKGTYKLIFTYARSWEKDSKANKTVEYTIKVSGKKVVKEKSKKLDEAMNKKSSKNMNKQKREIKSEK